VLPIRHGSPAGSGVQAPANAAFAEQLLRPGRFDERWRFFDANSRAIGESVRPARAFDPRERPWYRLAVKTPGQVVVTEPYVFSATREIGITVAATLRERPGAVAGADITLNDLSLFLSDQLPASNAKLLLFDAAGMVWASSEIQRLKASSKTELVPSLKEYGGAAYDALLPMASTALDVGQGSGVSHELRDSDQRQWRVSVGAVARVIGPPVFLAVLVDQDALQADLKRLRQLALLIAVAGVVLSGLLAFWAARRVSRPLQDLSIDATRLARLDLSDPNRPASGLREVDQVHESLRVARAGLQGYARYVPRRLVEHLLANHIEPVPSAIERDVTMFIASIEGLMPIIRNLVASELVERSEYYLQGVTDAVAEEDGIVDKFYGDALVCFFNAPVASSRHPSMACRAALAARSRFDAASEMAAMEGRGKLHVRFLLHTGVAVVGNFGTSERLTYTAVGVAPTVAARLMRCHAIYGSPTLVSGTVWAQAQRGLCVPVCRQGDAPRL
jgi:adenylate cyclase